jgi:hypothetical protein
MAPFSLSLEMTVPGTCTTECGSFGNSQQAGAAKGTICDHEKLKELYGMKSS